jgi:hypothetical protein
LQFAIRFAGCWLLAIGHRWLDLDLVVGARIANCELPSPPATTHRPFAICARMLSWLLAVACVSRRTRSEEPRSYTPHTGHHPQGTRDQLYI